MREHISDLQQRFGDAAMELLMQEYAQTDGDLLLERYRGECDRVSMPDAMDRHCRNLIQKSYQRMLIISALKRTARVAACILIMLCLAFPLAMSVEAFRIPVLNFILKEGKEFTQVSFAQNTSSFSALDQLRVIIWEAVPDGYQLTLENVHTDKHMGSESITSLFIRFQDDQKRALAIGVTKAAGSISVDSENAETTSMELFGQQAVILAKDGELRAIWVNEEQGQLYDVTGYGTGPDIFWECVHKLANSTQNPQKNISF